MSQADLFKRLGAPLKNVRWSWGAVSPTGAVFLRVWQDQAEKIDGRWAHQVTYNIPNSGPNVKPAYEERLKHVQFIKDGAPSYMVMCEAKDKQAIPRAVKHFNKNEVFIGGLLMKHQGTLWLERAGRVSVDDPRFKFEAR